MSIKENLIRCLDAGFPIVCINSYEEIKTDRIIRSAVGKRKIYEWNGAVGLCDFDHKSQLFNIADEPYSLENALVTLTSDDELDRKLLVIKDCDGYMDDKRITALLKYLCHKIETGLDSGIIIVTSIVKVPKELEKYITILEMEYLSEDEIRYQIKKFVDELEPKEEISLDLYEKMVVAFKGLSEYDIESLLASSIATYGRFTEQSLGLILEQKRQMIMKSNILEMVSVSESVEDIGGLNSLKAWLKKKAKVFQAVNRAREFGVDMPKGVLIAGVPGCGKSLTAKATAAMFKVPLLRLDMGRIMGMYVGESEKNMRNAIALAEAISPCVLWVDELEKAFAGVNGSGHEVTIRLFGTLLTWLQEKTSPTFVVATANDISQLPPELLRKGRFDDIFYVNLPNKEERKKIFEIHIKKRRKKDYSNIEIEKLIEKTNGYSGADIESVVVESIENAFTSDKDKLSTGEIIDVINETKCISDIMGEKLEKIKKFYDTNHFKSAT